MEGLKELKQAGEIASSSLLLGKKLIKKGASTAKIQQEIEDYIKSRGAKPAFPAQLSLNSVAAHQCDDEDVPLQEDLVKLDVGVHINGYIADNAVTIDLSGNYKDLVNSSKKALKEALKLMTPGTSLREIGKTIQQTITDDGFSPVRNLTGHALSRYVVHDKPSVPNIDHESNTVLKENMVLAVEPFASTGSGIVAEGGHNTLYTLSAKKPVRSIITRKVLQKITTYNGLPFTSRWLYEEFGKPKVLFALRELKQKGLLIEHPPLIDTQKGMVSQAEHTVIVKDKPIITTKNES